MTTWPNQHKQPDPAMTSLFHADALCAGRLMCDR
jgi:hypothetical protein